MSTTQRSRRPENSRAAGHSHSDSQGWMLFAAIILIAAAIMRFFDAVWAFAYNGATPDNLQNALFGHSLSRYGWLWLAVAIVLFVCGIGVLAHSQISRWVGIVAGAIAAVSAIWWMPYYPVWALTYVGLGILVIYALAAHGQPVD